MLGFGWCHLRSSRESLREASLDDVAAIDAAIDAADAQLWLSFREWMAQNDEPLVQWQFFEHLNNDHGLLTFCVSRNHRSSNVWAMLDWIVKNGPGSYGLFYCHDDEDSMDRFAYGRQPPMDYDNVYQVHRLLNGRIAELNDPFFGLIEGSIDPVHPYNRATNDE
jgi:hypothetical protein